MSKNDEKDKYKLAESIQFDIKLTDEVKISASLDKLITKVADLTDNFTSLKKLLNGDMGFKNFIMDTGTSIKNLDLLDKAFFSFNAVIGEFKLVSSGIYDLVKGTDNLVVSLAKVVGGAVGASAALNMLFGAPGLIVSGVTLMTSTIWGISTVVQDVADELMSSSIGKIILDTFIKPGGISLEEIHQRYSSVMTQIGDCFSELTSRTQVLEGANTNIRNTWIEIEKIKKAMDAGVVAVEDGKIKLETLFGELAVLAAGKFSELETTLLLAFGENGVLTEAFNELGYSAQDTVTMVLGLNVKVQEEIVKVQAELATLEPDSEEYAEKQAYLLSLTNGTDALTQAMQDYETLLGEMADINYEEFFEDGALNSEAVLTYLNSITSATSEAQEAVDKAMDSIRTALEDELMYANKIGDVEAAEDLSEKISAIPEATELLKNKISEKAKVLTDTIQTDLIDSINDTIVKAQAEWKSFDMGKRTALEFSGGPKTEAEYIKKAVEKTIGEIGTISDAVETALADLGETGAGWARDASMEIFGALFDSEYESSYMGVGWYVETFKENYSEIIDDILEKAKPIAYEASEEIGKEGNMQGMHDGMVDNSCIVEKGAKEVAGKNIAVTRKVYETHSPSKVFERIGKNLIEGLNMGILDNMNTSVIMMSSYSAKIIGSFSNIPNAFFSFGQMFIQGLMDGVASMENELYFKVTSIANNIKDTIKSSLEINSPSRVMFKLGVFTMEGFINGLETMYGKKSFFDIVDDIVKPANLYSMYGKECIPEYSSNIAIKSVGNEEDILSSNLLVPYLRQIEQNTRESAAKELSIIIGDRDIARANNRGQRSLGRRLLMEY